MSSNYELKDIMIALQTIRTELNENINTVNNNINEKFNGLVAQFESLKNNIDTQENRIDQIERDIRRNNLLIHGIPETETNYFQLENIICDFIRDKLNVECDVNELSFIRRIGVRDNNKCRPLNIGLVNQRKKIIIMKNAYKLKNTNTYITEDYPKKVIEKRKELKPQLIKKREEGYYAIIKYNELIVRNKIDKVEANEKKRKTSDELHTKKSESVDIQTASKKLYRATSSATKNSGESTSKNEFIPEMFRRPRTGSQSNTALHPSNLNNDRK